MSRSLCNLLKFSAPILLASALLSGCGSGSSGSADLNSGGSVQGPPPPVTVTESFDFKAPGDFFVVGTPPINARFQGGLANGNGAWIVPSKRTAVVDFATPADAVKFSTQDNYKAKSASAAGAAQKTDPLARAMEKVDAPFTVPMYVRGSVRDDWAATAQNQLAEVSDNVLALTMPLDVGKYQFKVADADWTGATNCGAAALSPVTLGVALTMVCASSSQNLSLDITAAGDYTFTFDVTGADKKAAKITVAKKETGGGGGGGTGPPPDSTEIRIFAVDVLTAGATPKLLKTVKGIGTLDVDLKQNGGAPRITRIEIENKGTAGDVGVESFSWTASPQFALSAQPVDINYSRPSGSVTGTKITVDGKVYDCVATTTSAFGCVAKNVPAAPFANASMLVANADGTKETITFNGGDGSLDIYAFSGATVARTGTPGQSGKAPALPANDNEVILFYQRSDNTYTGWGVHLFPTDPSGDSWTKWEAAFPFEGIDPQFGAYFRIALPGKESPKYSNNPAATSTFPKTLGFIIHKGDTKDPGPDQAITIAKDGNMVFVVSGVNDVGTSPPGSGSSFRITGAAAHWVKGDTLLWDPPAAATKVELLYSPDASIKAGLQGITGTYETIALSSGTNPKPAFNNQLANLKGWSLPTAAVQKARDLARGQLVMVGRSADGTAIAGTTVQTAGALDDLYASAASGKALGVTYTSGAPSLAVWAPTALKTPGVSVNVYDANGTKIESKPMTLDDASGVWSVTGTTAWDRKFYTISLNVFSYAANAIVANEVTDPYSVSLATDGVRSEFVNLDDADLKPAGWDNLAMPALAAPEDAVMYELHVRDFSIDDNTVPTADRGKFTAFDIPGTAGRQHLQQLAQAGLTHVHILPAFDFATVAENPADQVNLNDPVEKLCAKNTAAASLCATDSGKTIRKAIEDAVAANQLDRPPQIAEWLRGLDGFNWGYDPQHFGAPEGSYATDPNGVARVREFRRMVKGLNDIGLRTTLDVVYNHTNAAGQAGKSVLDKIVPGYYQRRNVTTGNVTSDSCCSDTAAEFKMFEKLMIDTGVRWVRDYKVSSFRFDIMSMHPLAVMTRFRDAVQAVDPTVYIYGEGWNCCGITDDVRFTAARQANLGGTGIGSFSDRIRDPVRGSFFGDGGSALVQSQGFVSGWYYDPNSLNTGSTADREALIKDTDNIRVWLAGGLASYRLTNSVGATVTGADIDYRGQKSGYTKDPQEALNYAEKHDNQTLWDYGSYKHPTGRSTADRVRAQNVAQALIILGQGVPFLHAGSEILRSKSGDKNSYDSGDWYNEIDWTLSRNTWAQGLPRAADNSGEWSILTDKYLDVTTKPGTADMQRAFDGTREFLQIRKSSPLFRLRTQAQVDQRVKFYNTGPFQYPGLIAMGIEGCTEPGLTPSEGALMVVFNASDDARTLDLFGSETWTLHPVQAASSDLVVKTAKHDVSGFYVPARTTAVFRKAGQTSCAPYPREMFVRGGFNNWADPPLEQYRLRFLGGTDYSVSAPITPLGNYEFKVADAGWTASTNCGAGAAGSNVRLGVPLQIECKDGSGNLKISAPSAGNYTFSLSAVDTAKPVLTVIKSPPTTKTLFVRGGFNDWGNGPSPTAPLAWDGLGTYRAVINGLSAQTYDFKIADNDWSGPTNCGGATGGTKVTIGQPYALTCDNNSQNMGVTFPAAGSYLFSVDASNPAALSLTVEKVPLDVPLFLRGLGGDWSDGAQNQMSYLGGGFYGINKAVAASAGEFKIASSDWSTANCGGTAAGVDVTPGTPFAMECGANPPNAKFAPAAAGVYTFTYKRVDAASGQLTVTGP